MDARKHLLPLLVLSLLAVTSVGVAQTWDATKDFSSSNPNGAWSYGWGVTGTSFTLYTIYHADCGDLSGLPGLVCWTADLRPEDHSPVVLLNTTGQWLTGGTVVLPPNALAMHPAPDWIPGDSIMQWTAPATATYRIFGFFEILDVSPSGIIVSIFRNGTLLYGVELLGPPAQYPNQPGGRANFHFPQLSLNAGDVISFGVNSDGTFYYDSTGFNATIVTPSNIPPCANCSQTRGQ